MGLRYFCPGAVPGDAPSLGLHCAFGCGRAAARIGGIGAQGSIAIPRSTAAVAKRRSARDASRRRCYLSGLQAVNNATAAQATTVVRGAEPGCVDV